MLPESIATFDAPRSRGATIRRRPLVLLGDGEGLVALHAALGAAMRSVGLRAAAHFAPHMTVHYGSRPLPAQAIEPIRIRVGHLALVYSELGRARHTVVERWPLSATMSASREAGGGRFRDRPPLPDQYVLYRLSGFT